MLGLIVLFLAAFFLLMVILSVVYAHGALHPSRRGMGYALGRNMACDPGDRGLVFEEWWLDLPGGARLPVWDIEGKASRFRESVGERTGGSDGGLTIVFVHGWGQSRVDMLDRIEPWKELGSRMILYDLRGHGDATPETGLSRLGSDEQMDLLALLDRLGEGPILLVGWSMGAGIAMEAAYSDHPAVKNIRGLILHAPYDDFPGAFTRRIRGMNLPGWPVVHLSLLWLRLRGLCFQKSSTITDSTELPVLIFHGGRDHISPPGVVEKVASILEERGAMVEVMGFLEAGHHDLHRVNASEYAAAVGRSIEVGQGSGQLS